MKRILITLLKYGISLSILAYLFLTAWRNDSFDELRLVSADWSLRNWLLLGCAFAVAMLAVSITFIRWYYLVSALDLPFTMVDAFRLGFLGYLFNFLTLGIVGGDALKAVFIARQQPGRRMEAVATVVVDRLVGIYALLLLTSLAFLSVDFRALDMPNPDTLAAVQRLGQVTFALVLAGTGGLAALLLPGFTRGPLWEFLVRLPRAGPLFDRLMAAVRAYRRRLWLVLATVLVSVGSHALFCLSVFLISRGLAMKQLSLGTYFMIVPIASAAGAIPLPGGLGAFEAVLDLLHRTLWPVVPYRNQGFMVALGFRIVTILIAAVGAVHYLTARKEVSELIKQAERESHSV